MSETDARYLEELSRTYPTAAAASAEIAKLKAMLSLPKGTEVFASDIHGEYNAFSHLLKNGAGTVRILIDRAFGDSMDAQEKDAFATLVYYPREACALALEDAADARAWLSDAIGKLARVARQAANGYAFEEVRADVPGDLAWPIEELLTHRGHAESDEAYRQAVIGSAIDAGCGIDLAEALGALISRLAISRLHLVGDIYDRGPAPHTIMDMLMDYPSIDVQWGNHDIVWMGAALGQRGCIAHVVRNCARYGNLSILEDAYGINLVPLTMFALDAYADDPCVAFGLKGNPGLSEQETLRNVKIQKAMAILQFKVEAQLIDENPSFGLEDRKLLHRIDRDKGTVVVDGVEYELIDTVFPTVDWDDPYRLTPQEEAVMQSLEAAFLGSEKLQRHMRFFLETGSLYKISNGYLMLHACVPLNADGSLKEANLYGETYKGRALYDVLDRYTRAAFTSEDAEERKRGRDLMWYMWLGEASPQFAKSKMATFELYLIADKAARKEVKNPFYSILGQEGVLDGIFEDFGMDPATSRIVCGHVPVKVKDGEDPVSCDGHVIRIDGGFSSAYQPTTGIAGFTLVSSATGTVLNAHEPMPARDEVVRNTMEIGTSARIIDEAASPILVADTDEGARIKQRIADLECLVATYR